MRKTWVISHEISCLVVFLMSASLASAFARNGQNGSRTARRSPFLLGPDERRFAHFPHSARVEAAARCREMFYFGFDSYMQHAFPADELDPIHCTGRGHDHSNPSNININDVLGDYSLTLIDSLDSLAVFGDVAGFQQAVRLVSSSVSFDRNTTVQVFEATIRVLGSLLSAHLIASDESRLLGDFFMADYDGELLSLARDLAARLAPAFDGTTTGIPYPRVNLQRGVPPETINETCTAGAGSLLLEFGILSRLTGDSTFESMARRINRRLWQLRNMETGLLGNVVDIQTGDWVGHLSGLGAGLDSFYEYLLKAYIMFGEKEDLDMFNKAYASILEHQRRGRDSCTSLSSEVEAGNRFIGEPPLYVNVDSRDGSTANTWIDSLQAAFPAVQTLAGDVEEAICHHSVYYAVWRKFGVLPERFNWMLKQPDVSFYPLRPEFAESTYHLYLATRNPFYLHVGREILDSLDRMTRVKCGFATVHDVKTGTVEDRMESFFLSETMKYLYLLFDERNPVNEHAERLLFSTEGHIFPIRFQESEELKNEEVKSIGMKRRRRLTPVEESQSRLQDSPANGDLHTLSSCEGATPPSLSALEASSASSASLASPSSVARVESRPSPQSSFGRHFNESCGASVGFDVSAHRHIPPLGHAARSALFESVGLPRESWW